MKPLKNKYIMLCIIFQIQTSAFRLYDKKNYYSIGIKTDYKDNLITEIINFQTKCNVPKIFGSFSNCRYRRAFNAKSGLDLQKIISDECDINIIEDLRNEFYIKGILNKKKYSKKLKEIKIYIYKLLFLLKNKKQAETNNNDIDLINFITINHKFVCRSFIKTDKRVFDWLFFNSNSHHKDYIFLSIDLNYFINLSLQYRNKSLTSEIYSRIKSKILAKNYPIKYFFSNLSTNCNENSNNINLDSYFVDNVLGIAKLKISNDKKYTYAAFYRFVGINSIKNKYLAFYRELLEKKICNGNCQCSKINQ